jgi:hypothetical protein
MKTIEHRIESVCYVIAGIDVVGVCADGGYSSGCPYIEFKTLEELVEFWDDLRKLNWSAPTPEFYDDGMLSIKITDIPDKHRSKFDPDVISLHVRYVNIAAYEMEVFKRTTIFEGVPDRAIKIATTLLD